MGNPQNPGWYDDPQNPEQLRYFDGIIWTDHVTARATRQAPTPATDGAMGAPAGQLGYGQGQQAGQWEQSPAGQWQQPPAGQYGPHSGYTPAPQAPWQQLPMGPTTTDGQPLASWWSRVLASLLDSLITGLVGGVLFGWLYLRAFRPFIDAFRSAMEETDPEVVSERMNEISANVLNYIDWKAYLVAAALSLALSLAYNISFHGAKGATPGKMAAGIAVRRTGAPGPIGFAAAARREAIAVLTSVVAMVPYLGNLGSLLGLVNNLWPLWDGKRQALHDKIADTQVVRTR